MATIKLARNGLHTKLVLKGEVLTKNQPLENLSVDFVLTFLGDPNLIISFEETDRKDLKAIDPLRFVRISKGLSTKITTHDELCKLVLPTKPKAKKTLAKTKKSALSE